MLQDWGVDLRKYVSAPATELLGAVLRFLQHLLFERGFCLWLYALTYTRYTLDIHCCEGWVSRLHLAARCSWPGLKDLECLDFFELWPQLAFPLCSIYHPGTKHRHHIGTLGQTWRVLMAHMPWMLRTVPCACFAQSVQGCSKTFKPLRGVS